MSASAVKVTRLGQIKAGDTLHIFTNDDDFSTTVARVSDLGQYGEHVVLTGGGTFSVNYLLAGTSSFVKEAYIVGGDA